MLFLELATYFNINNMTKMVQHYLKRKSTNLCKSFNLWFEVKSDVTQLYQFQCYILLDFTININY